VRINSLAVLNIKLLFSFLYQLHISSSLSLCFSQPRFITTLAQPHTNAIASIHDLPDELLLPILSSLNSRELNSLSKTSRKLRGIANEALYHDVHITVSLEQLPVLMRSVVESPDLARRVRSLVFPIGNGPMNVIEGWHQMIRETAQHELSGEIINISWKNGLDRRFMPACVKMLLCVLPNLEALDLSGGYKGCVDSKYTTGPYQVPLGLRELRYLRITMEDFDHNWSAALPKLSSLELEWALGQHQPYYSTIRAKVPQAPSRLTLNCLASVFSHNTLRYQCFTEIIRNYTNITHFKLTYTNILHPRDTALTGHRSKATLCECPACSPNAHSLIEKLKPL
jgi:hypothetical protein